MKKFRFRLQKLLDIRTANEKRIKNELAELVSLQNIERNKQQDLRDKMQIKKNELRSVLSGKSFSFNQVIVYERFTDSANRAINIVEERIKQMEPDIQRVRNKLIEASKEKKIVEKLKERKFKEFMYEYEREIAKENDDMNQKIYHKHLTDDMYQ